MKIKLLQKGNLLFPGIIIILLVTSYLIISIDHIINDQILLKNRIDTYLCFKFLNIKSIKYIKKINALNTVIQLAYPLLIIPALSAEAKSTIEASKTIQDIIYISYMKNLSFNSFCTIKQASSFIYQHPFKRISAILLLGGFKRKSNHTTQISKKKWAVWGFSKFKFIRNKKNILLKGVYKWDLPGKEKINFQFTEIAKTLEAQLLLKQYFGSLLSLPPVWPF